VVLPKKNDVEEGQRLLQKVNVTAMLKVLAVFLSL
jgi:hypothetical protein